MSSIPNRCCRRNAFEPPAFRESRGANAPNDSDEKRHLTNSRSHVRNVSHTNARLSLRSSTGGDRALAREDRLNHAVKLCLGWRTAKPPAVDDDGGRTLHTDLFAQCFAFDDPRHRIGLLNAGIECREP